MAAALVAVLVAVAEAVGAVATVAAATEVAKARAEVGSDTHSRMYLYRVRNLVVFQTVL